MPSRMSGRAAVGLALAAVLPAVSCGHEQTRQRSPTAVRVQAVLEHPLQAGLRYSASIEPYEQVSAAFKVSGYVREVMQRRGADGRLRLVQAGDQVEAGAVLAVIKDDDYRQSVAQAGASRAEAAAGLEKARLDLERADALLSSRSLTRADHDAAKASFDAALARHESAEARAQQADLTLEDCTLRAPRDSVVLERKIEVGSLVGSGTVGFVLADVSSVKAVFGVPDLVVGDVAPGSPFTVTIEALGDEPFAGTVTSVSPVADSRSRVFPVQITIPNPLGRLKPGMVASVSVPKRGGAPDRSAQARASVPVVPLTAVVRDASAGAPEGGYAVFVVEDQGGTPVARARRVELGEVFGNRIAATSGLRPGERVIVAGATLLTDGEAVRIVP